VQVWSNTIGVYPGASYSLDYFNINVSDTSGHQLMALTDINGDGLPDRIISGVPAGHPDTWWVQLNNGHGFEAVQVWSNTIGVYPGASYSLDYFNINVTDTSGNQIIALTDINGDGLPDRIISGVPAGHPSTWWVQFNNGSAMSGSNSICPPDTLIKADNGIGGKTEVTYKSLASLGIGGVPYPMFVATQIKVTDTQPTGSTPESYIQNISYQNAYFDPADREFRGFGAVTVTDPITGNYTETDFYQGKGTENPA